MTADVPLSEAARKILHEAPSLVETILTGGEDYEILCAVPPSQSAAFEAQAQAAGILVHPVGTARPGNAPPVFTDGKGRNLVFARPSFQHFSWNGADERFSIARANVIATSYGSASNLVLLGGEACSAN
jgi:thiamine monophosphate kinase